MCRAAHIAAVIDEVNANRITVPPARRQRTANNKPIPVILEPRMPRDNYRVANPEPVFPSKMCPEVVFWNAPVVVPFVFLIAHEMRIMFATVVTVVPAFMAAVVMP